MKNYFEGYYLKHQKDDNTLCIIVGKSNSENFIQVITDKFSKKFPLTKGNKFSSKGSILNIQTENFSLIGEIRYKNLSPIKYDIMGPFKFFSMECSHGIVSMHHELQGEVELNGEVIDFTGGVGYIEKDSGHSFPSSYVWIQANDFPCECSIMASIATIPFCKMHFRGCICVIKYKGKEYRLATYCGVRVITCTPDCIVLKQGKYRLEIRIKNNNSHRLSAPKDGEMTRTILESASCQAKFCFYKRGKQVFRLFSEHTGFEYEK